MHAMIKIKPLPLLLPVLAITSSIAFKPSERSRRPLLPRCVTRSATVVDTALEQGHINDDDEVTVLNGLTSRRSVLFIGSATLLTVKARPAAAIVTALSSARVKSWPGIETLEPLYEFKLSIDAIVTGVNDPGNWPFIKKRLEAFFGGFILSEKNYYLGVGLRYMNAIKYDEAELPNYVLLDKEARFNALDNTMKSLEGLKSALAGETDAATVEELAKSSLGSLQTFFALIPDQDVTSVAELFEHVQKADTNRDGRLSDDELIFLSPAEQELWKRRVSEFG